jgi:hypothetical protein
MDAKHTTTVESARAMGEKAHGKVKSLVLSWSCNRPPQDIPVKDDGTPLTHPTVTLGRRAKPVPTLSRQESAGLGVSDQTESTQSSDMQRLLYLLQHQHSASSTGGTVSMIPVSQQAQSNQSASHSGMASTLTTGFFGAKSK